MTDQVAEITPQEVAVYWISLAIIDFLVGLQL
jgi:hypothetical protein